MKVFCALTNLIRASNFGPYSPGASSIPSSLAMTRGFTGSRHLFKATRVSLAHASMSRGATATCFPLSCFPVEDFPFPLIEFFGGFIIDFLGTVQAVAGSTARQGQILFVVRTIL